MRRGWSAVWAAGLVGLVWVLLHLAWYPHHQLTDYGVYQYYGDAITRSHALPYRDVHLEYPPAALPTFIVPAWLERLDYRKVFQVEMLLCHLALVLAVLSIAGRRAAAFAAVAPLLLGSVVLSRFDLWPAALAAAALSFLIAERRAVSAVFLATSFAAKLWAAALAPVLLVWIWRRNGRRPAVEWLATALAVAAAWFLPFVALGGSDGLAYMFHRQLARPLQIESLGASLLIAAHHLVGTSIHVVSTFGSQNVGGPGAHAMTVLTSVAEAVALVAVLVLFARGAMTRDRLLTACAAAVAVVIAFGKVFSPQFLVWLIPLVPLVRRAAVWSTFALALVLTQVYFPSRYWLLAHRLSGGISTLVLLRDLAVVALAALLLYGLQGSSSASSADASSAVS